MAYTFLKRGRPGYLEPFVALDRGLVVKGYCVSGWRKIVARRLVAREDRAQSAMSRLGIAPMPVSSSGLMEGQEHIGFAMVHLSGRPPSSSMTDEVASKLRKALDAVHRAGWTHNDLHASNVLIDENGSTATVWIIDWTTATCLPRFLSGPLRDRDRRHLEKMIARAQGRPYRRPFLSRVWLNLQSWRRRSARPTI